ncbi:MAG: hypothetical protein CVU80_01945 [Elusimicrobia bacterium HGW-Elusimicrobia-4]|nr:MAG: hypothetical protein CVU80_01945 [Elusimicrobia bacterium HGW-Elusimicrobia-4]
MFRKIFISVILCFFVCADMCFSAFGKSGWTIFRKAQSAKFKVMTTVVAVRGDLSGVFYNPAVLGNNTQREIFFISELGLTEDKFGGLVYGEPLKNGAVAAGVVYYDAGQMELNWLDGEEVKTDNVSAQRDLLGMLSYGHKFSDKLFGGATLKFASSKIAELESAIAYCGDLGVFYLPTERLSVSAAVQNLGSSTKFFEKKNPLPSSGYIGSGYFYKLGNCYLLPGVGVTYNLEDEELIPEAGIEFGYDFVSINIGHKFNVEEANLHFGFGLNWKNIDFGYAYIPGLYLNTIHRLSVGYRFGRTSQ